MRKAQFKAQAERTEDGFAFYKALQYRWESNETADPQIDDESYHFTEEEAIKAAAKLDIGFEAQVDRITIDYDDLNEGVEFGQEFELSDLDDYRKFNVDRETIYNGETNYGKELNPDAIIVYYRHHTYMNYAYTIEDVRFVQDTRFKTEADLRNDADSISSTYCHLVSDLDELAEELRTGQWIPFNKINRGSAIVEQFLRENEHPDFVEEEEKI